MRPWRLVRGAAMQCGPFHAPRWPAAVPAVALAGGARRPCLMAASARWRRLNLWPPASLRCAPSVAARPAGALRRGRHGRPCLCACRQLGKTCRRATARTAWQGQGVTGSAGRPAAAALRILVARGMSARLTSAGATVVGMRCACAALGPAARTAAAALGGRAGAARRGGSCLAPALDPAAAAALGGRAGAAGTASRAEAADSGSRAAGRSRCGPLEGGRAATCRAPRPKSRRSPRPAGSSCGRRATARRADAAAVLQAVRSQACALPTLRMPRPVWQQAAGEAAAAAPGIAVVMPAGAAGRMHSRAVA